MLEYGDGFFGKNLPGAELARVDYLGARGNRSPAVTVPADTTEGPAPLTVHFTAAASDPEGAGCSTRGTSTPTAGSTRAQA